MPILEPILHSSSCIKKIEKPILTKDKVPYSATLVFNAGVTKFNGKYIMVFRNDYGTTKEKFEAGIPAKSDGNLFLGTNVGVAESDNGIDGWKVHKVPLIKSEDVQKDGESIRLYDPRISVIDGKPYLCLALDTKHGIRGCIAELNETFDDYNILSSSVPDNRNMVLFPEKIGGRYIRLERPMPIYSSGKDRFDIWLSESPDLKFWGESRLVAGVEDVPFSNNKIGPAAPPIKTDKGWLTLFHAVDIDNSRQKNGWEKRWTKRYTAGIMLLDLENPSNIIGMSKEPLIAPETFFEADDGFRQNVVFPGGMILEDSGEVKIYYGASDTVECLATADVNDLISLCLK